MGAPVKTSKIFVYAGGFQGPPLCSGKFRKDDRRVADDRQHWVFAVDRALAHACAGMCVNIGENFQLSFTAILPERSVSCCMKRDGAVVCMWVNRIVRNEFRNASGEAIAAGEQ